MYLINRNNNTANVTNPVYCASVEATNKEDTTLPGYEEHIYDTIQCYDDMDEHKVEPKGMAPSTASYQHSLQNLYDDDRVSIKSDDVSCDQSGAYSVPDFKEDGARSGVPKPLPKPRYTKKVNATHVADAQPAYKNLSTDEYVLHDATQRVNDEYVSLDTTHTGEPEEYITQEVTHTVEGNDYASLDATNYVTDNDYQEIVHQSPPPPGYAVPSNIPATS